MADVTSAWLVERIRQGDEGAWQDLIEAYEGRVRAFVRGRIRDRDLVDDLVQETFLGFLRSLPHYDDNRELEGYLFTIASHKVRDLLRKQGRHPLSLLEDLSTGEKSIEVPGAMRGPSSLLASAERAKGEEARLVEALRKMIDKWRDAGDFQRIQCIELLFVAGWPNREVARFLDLTEQQVANYKYQVIDRLRTWVQVEDGESGGP